MDVSLVIFIGISTSLAEILHAQKACKSLSFDPSEVKEGYTTRLKLQTHFAIETRCWYKAPDNVSPIVIYERNKTIESSKYFEDHINATEYHLIISNLRQEDAGRYIVVCNPSKTPHDFSEYATLKVQASTCGQFSTIRNDTEGNWVTFQLSSEFLVENITLQKKDASTYKDLEDKSVYYSGPRNVRGIISILMRPNKISYKDSGWYRVRCGNLYSNDAYINIEPIAPTKPTFSNVQDINDCKKCIIARLSKPITVECYTNGGSKPVTLFISRNGKELARNIFSEVKDREDRLTATFEFTPTVEDTKAIFRCEVKNPALQEESVVTANIYIYEMPSEIKLQVGSVKENQIGQIRCITYNGIPDIRPKIYINGVEQKLNPIQTSTDQTKTVHSSLTKTFNRKENNDLVACCVIILERKCGENKTINVTFPPQEVDVTEVEKQVTENGDTNLTLKCSVGVSNPPSRILWTTDKERPFITRDNLSDMIVRFNLTKEHNGRIINCSAVNDEFPELILTKTYTANITYAPLITISGNANRTVNKGDYVKLTCEVDSNPESKIFWDNGTHTLNETTGKRLDLIFTNISLDDSSTYSCIARNKLGGLPSKDVTLIVEDGSAKPSEDLANGKPDQSVIGPVIGGAVFIVVALIACTTFCLIRRWRKNPGPKKQKETPADVSSVKQERVSQVNTAEVQNPIDASNKNGEEIPEYASVAPKATRIAQKKESAQPQQEKGKSTGHELVYAELDLQTQPTVKPVQIQQQEATEYVGIDFAKTGTVKAEDFVEYGNI